MTHHQLEHLLAILALIAAPFGLFFGVELVNVLCVMLAEFLIVVLLAKWGQPDEVR